MIGFVVLGYAAQTGFGHSDSRLISKKRESQITYEPRKSIAGRASASDLSVPLIAEHFENSAPQYRQVKQLLHSLVDAGYKIGDYMPSYALSQGQGITLFVYDKAATRTTRPLESLGSIFLCAGDVDFIAYKKKTPGLRVSSETTNVAVFAEKANEPEPWLDLCVAILS